MNLNAADLGHQFPLRRQRERVERLERSLRCCVVAADRLDDVADELQANRLFFRGRIQIDDAPADEKLAVLIDRVLRREAGDGQAFAQFVDGNLDAGFQDDGGGRQPRWVGEPGRQRPCGGDHQLGRARGQRGQSSCARRGHLKVWREPAVRIHFLGGEGQYGLFSL